MKDRPSAPSGSTAPAVELHGITKRFPGVVANKDIEIIVRRGTVHAIVGENGAGKSTLMKILYGVQQPDEGTIAVNGQTLTLRSPTDAINAGIGMVFQHFMLADNLTVLENVVLGAEKLHGIGDEARKAIVEISDAYGLRVDPDVLVAELGVGKRQRVEILKVLYRGAKILILDEPTAVLVPQEVTELFDNLRELKSEGLTVIFISHKLDEVLSVADEITVIRRGTTVKGNIDPKSVNARQLAELMVGSELPSPQTQVNSVTDRAVLTVEHVNLDGATGGSRVLEDISLTIHAGEIVGIAGVEGNGQAELVEVVMGMREPTSGVITLDGVDISDWEVREIREAGVGYIPEDRHRHGMLLDAPLWENVILGHQTQAPNVGAGGLINAKAAKAETERIVKEYDVRTPSIFVTGGSLSGGNQQKLIIGREMTHDPKVLLAAHPTRGVDVGAQAAIWDHIKRARRAGLAVLLISADLEELVGLSDTIRVILRGSLSGDFDPDTVTREELGAAMTGANAPAPPRRPRPCPPRPGPAKWSHGGTGRSPGPAKETRDEADRSAPGRPRAGRAPAGDRRRVRRDVPDPPHRRRPGRGGVGTADQGAAAAPDRRDHQRGDGLLPLGDRRRHRVPDEPVQHRRRRPVPRRRVRCGRLRRPGLAAGAAEHRRVAARGDGRRRPVGRNRRPSQGDPRRQRGHLDDHAQRHRHLPRLVPAARRRRCASRAATRSTPGRSRSRRASPASPSTGSSRRRTSSTASSSWPSSSAWPTGSCWARPGSGSTCGRPGGPRPPPSRAASRCKRMVLTSMVISGAAAGLVGMPLLFGQDYTYGDTFQSGLGFAGIAIALLGRNNAIGIVFAALLWAYLDAQGNGLQINAGVSDRLVLVIQGVIVLSVVIAYELVRRAGVRMEQRRVASQLAAARTPSPETEGAAA